MTDDTPAATVTDEAPPAPARVELVGIALAALPVSVAKPIRVEPPTSDQWAPQTFTVRTAPVQVAGVQRRRGRALLRNLDDTNDVIVGPSRNVTRRYGYVIPPGVEVELRTTEELYAATDTGTAELTVSLEHTR